MCEKNYDCLKLDTQLCFPLYAISREVIKKYRPYLDELGLTYTQYITMLVMWEYKHISARNLGKKLFLDSGTLTPVLKCLESKGYVTRSRSVYDERVLDVEITDAGMALRERACDIPPKIAEHLGIELNEAKQLFVLLNKILNGFREQE